MTSQPSLVWLPGGVAPSKSGTWPTISKVEDDDDVAAAAGRTCMAATGMTDSATSAAMSAAANRATTVDGRRVPTLVLMSFPSYLPRRVVRLVSGNAGGDPKVPTQVVLLDGVGRRA